MAMTVRVTGTPEQLARAHGMLAGSDEWLVLVQQGSLTVVPRHTRAEVVLTLLVQNHTRLTKGGGARATQAGHWSVDRDVCDPRFGSGGSGVPAGVHLMEGVPSRGEGGTHSP